MSKMKIGYTIRDKKSPKYRWNSKEKRITEERTNKDEKADELCESAEQNDDERAHEIIIKRRTKYW